MANIFVSNIQVTAFSNEEIDPSAVAQKIVKHLSDEGLFVLTFTQGIHINGDAASETISKLSGRKLKKLKGGEPKLEVLEQHTHKGEATHA